jgi:hypothetical protein
MPNDNPAGLPANRKTAADMLASLTEKQAAFCHAYVIDSNASLAARTAGYSPKTSAVIAYKLLKKPSIQSAIQALSAELRESGAVNPEAVIGRLRAQAMTSPADLLVKRRHDICDKDGEPVLDPEGRPRYQYVWQFRSPDELTADQRAIISAVTLNTRHLSSGEVRQTVTYKTTDGQRALDGLARALGMNSETVRHDHSGTIEHKAAAVFEYIAANPEAADTTRRISRDNADNSRRRPVTIEGTAGKS